MKRFLLTLAVTVALVRVGAAQDVRAYEGALRFRPISWSAEKAPIFERDLVLPARQKKCLSLSAQ